MTTLLKTAFRFSLFAAAVATATPCFAQGQNPPRANVTFSDGTACTTSPSGPPAFVALSVATKASNPYNPLGSLLGGAGGFKPITFDDVALTRVVDDCSVSLYSLLFKGQRIHLVAIAFQNYVNGAYKDALVISLTNALITSIADTETFATAPAERVSLGFDVISIFDPTTGKTSTCDRTRGVCN